MMKTKLSVQQQSEILEVLMGEYGGDVQDWTGMGSFDRLCVKIEEVVKR